MAFLATWVVLAGLFIHLLASERKTEVRRRWWLLAFFAALVAPYALVFLVTLSLRGVLSEHALSSLGGDIISVAFFPPLAVWLGFIISSRPVDRAKTALGSQNRDAS